MGYEYTVYLGIIMDGLKMKFWGFTYLTSILSRNSIVLIQVIGFLNSKTTSNRKFSTPTSNTVLELLTVFIVINILTNSPSKTRLISKFTL